MCTCTTFITNPMPTFRMELSNAMNSLTRCSRASAFCGCAWICSFSHSLEWRRPSPIKQSLANLTHHIIPFRAFSTHLLMQCTHTCGYSIQTTFRASIPTEDNSRLHFPGHVAIIHIKELVVSVNGKHVHPCEQVGVPALTMCGPRGAELT